MKILIIGGAGYIGSHVAHAFVDHGDQVSIVDNFSTGSQVNFPANAQVFKGDILDEHFVKTVLSLDWDGVVHLAALKAAGESMESPQKYAQNNISGTINILNALVEAGSPAFVFSSSAAIFGEPVSIPIDENHPKVPENFYGFTKLEIENILNWYDRLKNMRFATLRYFNAAGYDPNGRVVEPEKDPQNLLPIIMELACGTRDNLIVNGNDYQTPDGTCIRDYVHVCDLADAHVLAMEYLIKKDLSISINLGSGNGISVLQMVDECIKTTGKNLPYSIGARRKGDPAVLIASSKLASNLLGWEAKRSDVETLVSSTWNIYK